MSRATGALCPLPRELGCQFHSHLMSVVASMVFMPVSGELVTAFEKHAAQVLA